MNYFEFKNLIINKFKEYINIFLDEKMCQDFFAFMNLLIEKNKVVNLTAITDPHEIIIKHFIDSCILFKFYKNLLNLNNSSDSYHIKKLNILDIGTGAGFPGIPLSIIDKNNKYTLTDTLGKRINFLTEVKDLLNLQNIILQKTRIEDFAHNKSNREYYDIVLSRGVAKISVLSEYSLPCVKINGKMIAYKMNEVETEILSGQRAISILGGLFTKKQTYTLYNEEPKRCLLEISKIKSSPKSYPRKAGIPTKNPL